MENKDNKDEHFILSSDKLEEKQHFTLFTRYFLYWMLCFVFSLFVWVRWTTTGKGKSCLNVQGIIGAPNFFLKLPRFLPKINFSDKNMPIAIEIVNLLENITIIAQKEKNLTSAFSINKS